MKRIARRRRAKVDTRGRSFFVNFKYFKRIGSGGTPLEGTTKNLSNYSNTKLNKICRILSKISKRFKRIAAD